MNLTQFQQTVSSSDKPLIVDVWASWCIPCKLTKPILEKLAREYKDRVAFLPINADESRELLEKFQISGIPTVLTLRDGKVVGRVTGARSESQYRAMFAALAKGDEVKVPMSEFERVLRLGAGALFVMIGISTSNWLALGVGGLIAFLGIYDRCPVWAAIMGMLQQKYEN
jgi:thioredoxin 1